MDPSVKVPAVLWMIAIPEVGAVKEYQTSRDEPVKEPQPGATAAFVLVAETFVLAESEQLVPTVNEMAPQGSSFAGGSSAQMLN